MLASSIGAPADSYCLQLEAALIGKIDPLPISHRKGAMLASRWLRAASRGVFVLLMTAFLLGRSPMVRAESPQQRQELAAALRQLDALERTVARSAAHTPFTPGRRYHFDYPRLLTDLARVRTGIQTYLTPARAQPRDLSELADDYRSEHAVEPQPVAGQQR